MEMATWRFRLSPTEWPAACGRLALLLAPAAPNFAEELWSQIGGEYSVHRQRWPAVGDRRAERVTLVVQVDGRVRDRVEVDADLDAEQALEAVRERPMIARHLEGEPARVVHVPDRLLNLVTVRGQRSRP